MFDDSCSFAFYPFPCMREELAWMERQSTAPLVDKLMEILQPWTTCAAQVEDAGLWSIPQRRSCPRYCWVDFPQSSFRQHFVILPGQLPAFCCTKHESNEQKTDTNDTCGHQSKGSDAGNSEKKMPESTSQDAADNTNSGKTSVKSPWQFSVDMKGCDEVRATTEGDLLTVEGRGSSITSHQLVRYTTSLPPHLSHDTLSAILRNGRLTITQRIAPQLEGQAKRLPSDVQQEQQEEQPREKQRQFDSTEQQEEEAQSQQEQQHHSKLPEHQEARSSMEEHQSQQQLDTQEQEQHQDTAATEGA